MSEERVSERTLERMMLGELDDEESRRILRRLEAEEGGPERLERLIADREAFLEQYPPEMMAARIREKYRRKQRTRPSDEGEKSMFLPRPTARLTALAAAALVLLGVGVVLFSQTQNSGGPRQTETKAVPAAGGEESEPRLPARKSAEKRADDRPLDAELPKIVRWDGKSKTETPLGVVVDGRRTLVLAVGQIATLKGEGVERLELASTSVAYMVPADQMVYLEGKASGVTELVVRREAGPSLDVRVVVAPEMERSVVEQKVEADHSAISACFEGSGGTDGALKVRLLAQDGRVSIAHPEFSELPTGVETCVLRHVREWKFEGVTGRVTGTYRFATNEGGLCEPGEEC